MFSGDALNRVIRPFFSSALKSALERLEVRNSEIGSAQSGISKCVIWNFEVCNFKFGNVYTMCDFEVCAVCSLEFGSVLCVISKCAVCNYEIGNVQCVNWKLEVNTALTGHRIQL